MYTVDTNPRSSSTTYSGELISTDKDKGCDEFAVTSILDMSALVTEEMCASVEDCRELLVLPGPPVVSMTVVDSLEVCVGFLALLSLLYKT